jgi:hypothetical protein
MIPAELLRIDPTTIELEPGFTHDIREHAEHLGGSGAILRGGRLAIQTL